jgi:hypothetical protein
MSERKTIDLNEGKVFETTVTASSTLTLGATSYRDLPFEERLAKQIADLPAQQRRGALHSLDLIAKGTPDPQHFAGIALKHLGVSPAPFFPQLPEDMMDVFTEAARMLSKHVDGEFAEDFERHLETLKEIVKHQIPVPPVPLPPQLYLPALPDGTVEALTDAHTILNVTDDCSVPADMKERLFPLCDEIENLRKVISDHQTVRISGVMLGYVGTSAAKHLQDYTAHGTPNSIRVYNTPDVVRGITKRVLLLDDRCDTPPTKQEYE